MMTEAELKRELACHRLALEWAMQMIDFYIREVQDIGNSSSAIADVSSPIRRDHTRKPAYLADARARLQNWLVGHSDRMLDELLYDLYPNTVSDRLYQPTEKGKRSITDGHREN